MPYLIGAGLLVALGYASDKAGQGISDAGSGLVKMAIAGSIGFVVLKKAKVI